jgi:hypothetical protein
VWSNDKLGGAVELRFSVQVAFPEDKWGAEAVSRFSVMSRCRYFLWKAQTTKGSAEGYDRQNSVLHGARVGDCAAIEQDARFCEQFIRVRL